MAEKQSNPASKLPRVAALKAGMIVPIDDVEGNETKGFDISLVLPTDTSNPEDFRWVPGTYGLGNAVSYQGFWYVSLANGNTAVPGTDVTKWERQNAGGNYTLWAPGVFYQDLPLVYRNEGTLTAPIIKTYALSTTQRPFVSTDFEAEVATGKWSLQFFTASPEAWTGDPASTVTVGNMPAGTSLVGRTLKNIMEQILTGSGGVHITSDSTEYRADTTIFRVDTINPTA